MTADRKGIVEEASLNDCVSESERWPEDHVLLYLPCQAVMLRLDDSCGTVPKDSFSRHTKQGHTAEIGNC